MNGKTLRNFLIIYLVILLGVIMFQIPKEDLSAKEPAYKVEIDDKDLSGAIIMSVNSSVIFVGNEQTIIDPTDVDIVPRLVDGSTYVPIQFFKNILGAQTSWNAEKKETTARYNNKAVIYTNGSDQVRVVDNDSDKTLTAASAPIIVKDRMYVPLRLSVESFGKRVFYGRGIIVISDYDLDISDDLLDELVAKMTKLPVIGNEENLEILLGKPEELRYDNRVYMLDDAISFDAAVAESAPARQALSSAKSAAAGAAATNGAAEESAAADDYSKTNVQVEGVDEGDIIKTDGEYIYYVKDGDVQIVKAYPPESMDVVSVITPMGQMYGSRCDNAYVSELYINDGKLIVVGSAYMERNYKIYPDYETITEETTEETTSSSNKKSAVPLNTIPRYDYYDNIYYRTSDCTFIDIYDVTDKANPKLKKQVIADGDYVSSRLTNGCVYTISNTYLEGLIYKNRYISPVFYDSTVNKEPQPVDFSKICYIPERTSKKFMNVASIDLSDLDKEAGIYTTVASGDEVYMSQKNLYVANVSGDTDIYKYELGKGYVDYAAHGKVSGGLHNQFSMDENDGYFRITTTEWQDGRGYSERSNSLYILDQKLDVVSSVKDIAPGESIYSTRFMGNRAYMVTFETVDPLFVIDVADPQNPKILGALKIPGYSDYLHPYDDNHLIGIGKDTFVYGDMAYYKGMKLSMFDVTDVSDPKEMFTEIIGDRGTDSEVLDNHKALLFDKEKNVLAFPVSIYLVPENEKNKSNEPTRADLTYGMFDFQGFLRYSIDMENGFKLEGKTTHMSDEDLLKSGNYRPAYDKEVTRGLLIGNTLYTVSDYKIVAESLDSGKELGSTLLKD